MIPSTFVRMERLPLTTHGKIDRASLPTPNVENALGDNASVTPLSPVEERVAVLLKDLLAVNSIGTNDNFFHLGGHSLLGAQVIARVRDIFEVELSLRSIFDYPTVKGISAEIESLILNKIENLTDEEAQSMLAHERETAPA
jgi:acyl carrier protein